LSVAYIGEYGRELSEPSVFNLLWLIASEKPDPFRVFADSDERFHAHLGSDTFTSRLSAALEREVELETRLVRVQERRSDWLRLVLDQNGRRGRLHFCGEHTSGTSQGYMEGAAESGERSAAEVG
jgi:hypothetical protein